MVAEEVIAQDVCRGEKGGLGEQGPSGPPRRQEGTSNLDSHSWAALESLVAPHNAWNPSTLG